MARVTFCLFAVLLASCASSGSGWTPASWAAQGARTLNQGPYAFFAAPYGEDGFQLSLKIDASLFSAQSERPLSTEELVIASGVLRDAANAAAPEGCQFTSMRRIADDEFIADYDCD